MNSANSSGCIKMCFFVSLTMLLPHNAEKNLDQIQNEAMMVILKITKDTAMGLCVPDLPRMQTRENVGQAEAYLAYYEAMTWTSLIFSCRSFCLEFSAS